MFEVVEKWEILRSKLKDGLVLVHFDFDFLIMIDKNLVNFSLSFLVITQAELGQIVE